MEEIIAKIWELPWHKVLWIAIADDFILLVKVWPLWAMILLVLILFMPLKKGDKWWS